ncbi:SDR family NAD(P)-dependent oxidoreductase [Nocardioides sp. JQ2195]|uniref:SDR family NAD(P)-dependent oxidoreductase n=1 Tax=Nocardioides sp. JQ2195 TaxID=2592334 RepID=UPI00143E6D3C|nr:SDR family NAD(P)-dependent oxidoreductase [Nocardioides sp. JQ2195]QIX26503.1 SDR family NAD(P)-dependent oxidoreductase [Nocardioides sp. JQ2195]
MTGLDLRPAAERVVVVTGASRGAGKGIALALGETGATVYVTGRSRNEGDAPLPGTVGATAEEIDRRGGRGVPVICDHSDDVQVAALFDRIRQEHGLVDVLVNNAYVVPDHLADKGPFWEKPLALQDQFDVGLRSTYVASHHAAPLLVASGAGLVVNTSSFGGGCYMHGPAYGAVKAGVDKMAHDMAVDFRPHDVAVVSIWMGLLRTERTAAAFDADPERYGAMTALAESPEFTGRVIAALADAPERMTWSGQILVGAEIGSALGVTDVDGSVPTSPRGFLGNPTTWNSAVVD